MKRYLIIAILFAGACSDQPHKEASDVGELPDVRLNDAGVDAQLGDADIDADTDADVSVPPQECTLDRDCPLGHACRDAWTCEELPPCNAPSDCMVGGAKVGPACINAFCDFCVDNADCAAGEVCFDRLCAHQDDIDPTCLSADGIEPPTCEQCDVSVDEAGVATGIFCAGAP